MNKPKLILVSATAGTIEQFERAGFADRQKMLVREYAERFDVEYYTADIRDYSCYLGVIHHPLPFRIKVPGLKHILFWIYLIVKAPKMKGPIRTFGVEIPTLPLVKLVSRQKIFVGFQWDYAATTKANYRGIKRWLAGSLQRLGFRGADLAICTVSRLKEIAERDYEKKAVVLPNFVDLAVFQRIAAKDDSIVYAGRLHWSKGVESLIDAFDLVSRELPSCRLLIFGQGEEEDSLKKKVTENSMKNIYFPGVVPQTELAEHVARAKVFVLPTVTSEGHPKALIEAMAAGTACVATRVPGNADVINDDENGKLIEPRDHRGLAAIIVDLMKQDDLRRRLENNAHDFARRNYQLKAVLDREESIMRELSNGTDS